MKKLILYRCNVCGNLVCMVENSGVTPVCCGEDMELLAANTADAATEKHVPIVRREGGRVIAEVGEKPHPMTEAHHIGWIVLLTDRALYAKELKPDDVPAAAFTTDEDEIPIAVYAWCNLHGLWRRDV